MKAALTATPIALTVELPFQHVARGQRPPAPLPRERAEQLADAVGEDLQRLMGDALYDCGMVLVGALYDLPEILQPGFPCVDAVSSVYRDAMPEADFVASVLAIGGRGGRFPIPGIAPIRQPGAGPLLALPLVFVAPPETIDRIAPALEEKLLHRGQAGLNTARLVQDSFGVRPQNLTFATFNDLCALMKVQLDHGGFGPLWNLIEAALFQRGAPLREQLDAGNRYLLTGGRAHTPYYTVAEWLNHPPAGVPATLAAYLDWLRLQRQYDAGLAAHGIQVVHERPAADDSPGAVRRSTDPALADPDVRSETTAAWTQGNTPTRVILLEHGTAELGPVAYSLAVLDERDLPLELTHRYPLNRRAMQRIEREARERAGSLGVELEWRRPREVALDEAGTDLAGPDRSHLGKH